MEPEARISDCYSDQMRKLRRDSAREANLDRIKRRRMAVAAQSILDLSLLGSLPTRNNNVFAPESMLWRELKGRRTTNLSSSQIEMLGEDGFCEFNFFDHDTHNWQRRHFSFWTRTLKDFLRSDGASYSPPRLLDSVPPPPQTANSCDRDEADRLRDLGKFLAKYNWQFRRPYPLDGNVDFDTWQKAPASTLDAGQLEFFSGMDFCVCADQLRETSI